MVGIIAARSKNGVIGKDGKIPWRIAGEQAEFKELTTGNSVIMGRKTYEEIGRPLPHRLTVVVTNSTSYGPFFEDDTSLLTARSLEDALILARNGDNNKNIYIAGGAGLFREALEKDIVDRVYLTEVDLCIEGENLTKFPDFDEDRFCMVDKGTFSGIDKNGNEVSYRRTAWMRERTREQEEEVLLSQ